MESEAIHVPVLINEVLEGLQVRAGGTYIDCTLGTGGHAAGILQRSGPDGRLLGIDLDVSAIEIARTRLAAYSTRSKLARDDFARLEQIACEQQFIPADGVLLDLGVSSLQLHERERGFSFQQEGPLDMRFDLEGETTASFLVNELREQDLADILASYGEEPKAKVIARTIVENRPVQSTMELANLVVRTVRRRRKLHPATRTFQALRIAVNEELGALSRVLPQISNVLASGGRMAIIAFHSLEDRVVKRFMAHESRNCICPPQVLICACQHQATLQVLTRKPIRPSSAEVQENPRSRSARLRVAARL